MCVVTRSFQCIFYFIFMSHISCDIYIFSPNRFFFIFLFPPLAEIFSRSRSFFSVSLDIWFSFHKKFDFVKKFVFSQFSFVKFLHQHKSKEKPTNENKRERECFFSFLFLLVPQLRSIFTFLFFLLLSLCCLPLSPSRYRTATASGLTSQEKPVHILLSTG